MGKLTVNRNKMKMTAVWIHPLYHEFIRMVAARLGVSNKAVVEIALEDYTGRNPELGSLWEDFQNKKKEYLNKGE